MLSHNLHTVIGNLGKDPEIRSTKGGNKVANFSVATTAKVKGEKVTDWHNVVVFGDALIDNVIVPYVKKGGQVMVSGPSKTRKWADKSGNDRYTTEIIVSGPGSTITLGSSRPSKPSNDYVADDDFGQDVPFDDPFK